MKTKGHQLLILRPNETFASRQEVLQVAGFSDLKPEALQFFELPLIAVILNNRQDPHAPACNFLLEKALQTKGITGDTARSYGEALCGWLDFLAMQKCSPNAATEEELGLYRLHLLGAKPESRKHQASTVNHRLTVAIEFHRWGQLTQNLESPLGNFLERTRQISNWRNRPMPRWRNPHSYLVPTDRRLPKVLTQEEIVRLFKVAPRPFDLMFRWAIATGMRRVEICGLQLKQLPSPSELSRSEGGLMMIDVHRKGGRLQSVAVPSQLIEDTAWYVMTDRSEVAAPDNNFIFLGRAGRPVSRQRLTRVFRECANAINSKATLHHLRHTFAVKVLHALESYEGDGQAINPLKGVQVLLGHASIETTQIYLKALSLSNDAVRQALDYLYGGTID